MSTCSYCEQSFSGGGVSVNGLGTFCGYQCRVFAEHERSGKVPELHYFRCRHCSTVLVVSVKSSRPEQCRCSGSWMTFLHSVRVERTEQKAFLKRGVTWLSGFEPPEPWTCVRCGEPKAEIPRQRPDGKVCTACYRAESPEPFRYRTAEEAEADGARKDALLRDAYDRVEQAYRLAEQEQR